jgi:hypothetical protein
MQQEKPFILHLLIYILNLEFKNHKENHQIQDRHNTILKEMAIIGTTTLELILMLLKI